MAVDSCGVEYLSINSKFHEGFVEVIKAFQCLFGKKIINDHYVEKQGKKL